MNLLIIYLNFKMDKFNTYQKTIVCEIITASSHKFEKQKVFRGLDCIMHLIKNKVGRYLLVHKI